MTVVTTFARDSLLFQPGLDAPLDLVADFAELSQFLTIRAFEGSRVFERPVHARINPRLDSGTVLVGIVTDGDEVLEQKLAEIYAYALGCLAGNVNPGFLHHLGVKGINYLGFQAGAVGFEAISGILAQEGFCHLAAGRIAGAEELNTSRYKVASCKKIEPIYLNLCWLQP